jgi:hypothetical protein
MVSISLFCDGCHADEHPVPYQQTTSFALHILDTYTRTYNEDRESIFSCMNSGLQESLFFALASNHTKNVWVLFKKPKLVAIAAKQKKIETK